MCGRYWVEPDDAPEVLAALLKEADARADRLGAERPRRGEVRPGDTACVLSRSKAGSPAAFPMRWGFRSPSGLVFNARTETAPQRPMFRESWQSRRCLIPASAWFEWDHRPRRPVKCRFAPQQRAWFCLAGLYRLEEDGRPDRCCSSRTHDSR